MWSLLIFKNYKVLEKEDMWIAIIKTKNILYIITTNFYDVFCFVTFTLLYTYTQMQLLICIFAYSRNLCFELSNNLERINYVQKYILFNLALSEI